MKKAASAGDNLGSFREELKNLKEELQKTHVVERRYITHDPTVEKLGELLRDNPRGLLLLRDELAGWLWTLERLGREGDREFYLESWDGTSNFTFDRIGRGTVSIPFLTLSILEGIQPSKLHSYFAGALTEKGCGADGLLQRFQIPVWPDSLPEWENIDRVPDIEAHNQAIAIFEQLACSNPSDIGTEILTTGDIPALRFEPEAQDFFNEWRDHLERRLRSSEMENQPAFESHLAKFRSLMPSLSLLFHLTEVATGKTSDASRVGLHNSELAAAWCDFLEAHALKVYALEKQESPTHVLADRILEGKVRDGMTCRDICRKGWGHLNSLERVKNAAQVLEKVAWVRLMEQPSGEKGGRPAFLLRINPRLEVSFG